MKIVYVAASLLPSRFANSVHVMKMCRAMSDLGHEVSLLVPDYPETRSASVDDVFKYYGIRRTFEIEKIGFPRFRGGIRFFPLYVRRKVEEIGPDLVFGRHVGGVVACGLSGRSVVLETHHALWEHDRLDYALFRVALSRRMIKRIVVISEALKSMYVRKGIVAPEMLLPLHDGADEVENSGGSTPFPLRGRPEVLRIGYTGHLYEGRGVGTMLEAARLVPDVDFHVFGGIEDDLRRWSAKREAEGITNVHFYGHVEPARIDACREAMDVLLAPYQRRVTVLGRNDTSAFMSPLKIFEYMASCKPMIVSDMPVIREVLDDSMAMLVPPDDAVMLARAILDLRNDPVRRRRMASAAHRHFVEHYTWRRRAEQILTSAAAC